MKEKKPVGDFGTLSLDSTMHSKPVREVSEDLRAITLFGRDWRKPSKLS